MGDRKIRKIALTGSIAMGKSTVANMIRDLGIPVFDADAIVHEMYEPQGKAVEQIGLAFPGVVVNGKVDRQELSKVVLGNPDEIKKLEQIVHPLVRQAQDEFLVETAKSGHDIVVFDIPLLFEQDRSAEFDVVLVVSAPNHIQEQRAMARPGMTKQKLNSIMARQTPDSEKRKLADHVIMTDVALEETRQNLSDIITEIRSGMEEV